MNPRHKSGDVLHEGKYQIERVLGGGGQGVVYLARHRVLGARMAIKEIFEGDRETREQFLWQAQVLVRLQHVVLPRVTDFFTEKGCDYLVMDYIEGYDLDQLVRDQGRQDVRQVLVWAAALLDGLHYLHSQQPRPIIHRDIKPPNLRLTREGRLYLVDFGLAKLGGADVHTYPGAWGITKGYSPVEQYRVDGRQTHTDARSDLYALGATLWFLLTGSHPPDSRVQGASGTLPIRTVNPSVPVEVERWVQRAMMVAPEERWPSAAAMRQAMPDPRTIRVRPVSGGVPVQRPGTTRRSSRPSRLPSSQILLFGLVGVLGVMLVSLSLGLLVAIIGEGNTSGGTSGSSLSQPTIAITIEPAIPSPQPTTTSSPSRRATPIPDLPIEVEPTITLRALSPSQTPTPPPTSLSLTPPPEVPSQSVTLTLLRPSPQDTTSDRLVSFQVRADGYQVDTHRLFIMMSTDPNNLHTPASLTRSNFSNGVWVGDVTSPPGNFGTWYWTARVIDNQGTIVAQTSEIRRFEWNAPRYPSSGGEPTPRPR